MYKSKSYLSSLSEGLKKKGTSLQNISSISDHQSLKQSKHLILNDCCWQNYFKTMFDNPSFNLQDIDLHLHKAKDSFVEYCIVYGAVEIYINTPFLQFF